jgi:hypothetical protein
MSWRCFGFSGTSADGGASETTLIPGRVRVSMVRLFSGLGSEDASEIQAPEWRRFADGRYGGAVAGRTAAAGAI